jgi:TonB-linked SusC/RagA family outer membrane protein
MKMKFEILVILFCLFSSFLFGQKTTQILVTGKVIDSSKSPLTGVSVGVKGTTRTTVTDSNGNYTLTNIPENSTLRFSFIGMKMQEIGVGTKSKIDVIMEQVDIGLNEVVVVGYGTQKKANLTGAVSSVNSKDLTVAPVASVSNALAGRLPGLITKQENGAPGKDGSMISIRGFGSPLIIVDGVEGSMDNLSPNEIENISILKDASAAIYGARAGNGVVLINTKRGINGKPTITVNGTYSLQSPVDMLRMVGSGPFSEMWRETQWQLGIPEANMRFRDADVAKYKAGTDKNYPSTNWTDELIGNFAKQLDNNISLRGGTDKLKFYAYFGLLDQKSIINEGGGGYQRYNIRVNADAKIIDNLTFSVDLSTTMSSRTAPWRDDNFWQDLWGTEPIYPRYLPDRSKISYADGGGTGGAHITTNRNLGGGTDINYQSIKVQGGLKYDFSLVKGLFAKATMTAENGYSSSKTFVGAPETYKYNNTTSEYKQYSGIPISLFQNRTSNVNTTGQFSLNYDNVFAKNHHFSALSLYEFITYNSDWISASREGYESFTTPYLFAGGLLNQKSDGSADESGRVSWVNRFNYDYKSKYLLEATVRNDGSAQFSPEKRWGLFPSISVGWRISQEGFLNSSSVISNLKIRGGISQTGNDAIPIRYPFIGGYIMDGSSYIFGTRVLQGYTATGIPNKNLTWETVDIYNLGLDFGLFKGALFGQADVFYRNRIGIPGQRSTTLPNTFGAGLPLENLNELNTRGFEFMLGYKNSINQFKYNITANVSWSRSKWGKYDQPVFTDPDEKRIKQRTGHWVDETFGWVSDGLFTKQKEIDDLKYVYDINTQNAKIQPGDIHFLNINGDDRLDWRDQVLIGHGSVPNWMMGLNTALTYRGFDFNALINSGLGFVQQVNLRQMSGYPEVMYNERWTYSKNNPQAIVPRLGSNAPNGAPSDFYFIQADYMRLKSLSLGYTLPNKWTSKVKLQSLRVYFAATNLYTLSKLSKYGLDPEAPSGMSGYYYPQMKTYSFGLNISF